MATAKERLLEFWKIPRYDIAKQLEFFESLMKETPDAIPDQCTTTPLAYYSTRPRIT